MKVSDSNARDSKLEVKFLLYLQTYMVIIYTLKPVPMESAMWWAVKAMEEVTAQEETEH